MEKNGHLKQLLLNIIVFNNVYVDKCSRNDPKTLSYGSRILKLFIYWYVYKTMIKISDNNNSPTSPMIQYR